MSSSFLTLLDQNRSQTAFLPAVVFGYIYVKFGSFTVCSNIVNALPSLGGSRLTFLGLAMGSTVLAAVMYGARTEPESPDVVGDLWSWAVLASVVQFTFLAWSFVELGIRACSQDIIIIGLFLLYVALIVIRVTEVSLQIRST
jgi:hypothetical protein